MNNAARRTVKLVLLSAILCSMPRIALSIGVSTSTLKQTCQQNLTQNVGTTTITDANVTSGSTFYIGGTTVNTSQTNTCEQSGTSTATSTPTLDITPPPIPVL